MSWFRQQPEVRGWRIITRHNEALDKTVYRVYREGDFHARRHPESYDFNTHEEALAFYHDMVGWQVEKVEQP